MEFTKEEIALMKQLGIKPPKQSRKKADKEASVKISLDEKSGEITNICKCCGSTTITYVDFVKRFDCEGYAINTVEVPSHRVTERMVYNVVQCIACRNEVLLENYEVKELVRLINNLRRYTKVIYEE
jgi:hypothetical protein